MIPIGEPEIKRNDRTPSILAQAEKSGWKAGIYNFGKAEGPAYSYFNSGLVERPDGLWLLARRSENVPGSPFGYNAVWAIKLDESGHTPLHGKKLKWINEQDGQQYEDARAFYLPHLNQVGVSVCTFKWHGDRQWTGAIQMLGFFNQDWDCKVNHYVPFENNALSLETVPRERYQKNWLFWLRDKTMMLLYKSDPWTVAMFGNRWDDRKTFVNEGAKWSLGEIRGGTPPVLVDDRYYTFFHSSMPWRGNYRRYFAGVIAFSAEPPFEVLSVSQEPLLTGSQQSRWEQRKPLCVFPCGAVIRNGTWLVTMGSNDLESVWMEIPHADILERLNPKSRPLSQEKLKELQDDVADSMRADLVANTKPAITITGDGKGATAKKSRTPEQLEVMRARMAVARAARTKKAERRKKRAEKSYG